MSSGVREPTAAGSLYAADSQQLRAEVDAAIKDADSEFTGPKLLVLPSCGASAAPHVAGDALIMLESERDFIERVIIISDHVPGPNGRPFVGIALPRAIAFRTPLGDLLTDRASIDALAGLPNVVMNDRPFERDTSIEVHLPPVQRLLGTVRVVPILVGEAAHHEVVEVLERLWGSRETLIIVSSSFGTGVDAATVSAQGERYLAALVRNKASTVPNVAVSSPRSLDAMMTVVGRRSMGLLELSSDSIDDPTGLAEVVEVASLAGWESHASTLSDADATHMRSLARAAVELTVLGGKVEGSDVGRVPPAIATRRASVVTLRHQGQTRGSAGTIEADRSLAGSVVRNASAACADPRLPSITPSELSELEMVISVVSPIERIFPTSSHELFEMLQPGRHGVLITTASARAAQLPAMWSRYPSHREFVQAVAAKAGVGLDDVASAACYRFETTDY